MPDGTHPNPQGREKVAQQLMNFFLNSPYAKWFKK
jgi:lysophospholipase L1-like esterase